MVARPLRLQLSSSHRVGLGSPLNYVAGGVACMLGVCVMLRVQPPRASKPSCTQDGADQGLPEVHAGGCRAAHGGAVAAFSLFMRSGSALRGIQCHQSWICTSS